MRSGAKARMWKKEPSALPWGRALLKRPPSGNTLHLQHSRSSSSDDRAIANPVDGLTRRRLGAPAPSATQQPTRNIRRSVRSRGGAAPARVTPCTLPWGTSAPRATLGRRCNMWPPRHTEQEQCHEPHRDASTTRAPSSDANVGTESLRSAHWRAPPRRPHGAAGLVSTGTAAVVESDLITRYATTTMGSGPEPLNRTGPPQALRGTWT